MLLSVFNRPVAQSLHNTLQNCFGGDFAGEKGNVFEELSFNEFGEQLQPMIDESEEEQKLSFDLEEAKHGKSNVANMLSAKGRQLIEMYTEMAANGYYQKDGTKADSVYNDFEMKKFRNICREKMTDDEITTVLDYGGGGSDWDEPDFDLESGQSAKQFFEVSLVNTFEPARNELEKTKSDCVICMDVLEHIFVSDVPKVVNELFSLAKKLLIINVACYEAIALLPNGENAHITIRNAEWWKGVIDATAVHFEEVEVMLICSTSYASGIIYEPFRASDWHHGAGFSVHTKSASYNAR